MIFVGGSLLQLISPEILIWINSLHLNDSHLARSLIFIESNILVGFTSQSGVNGYLLSVAIILILAEILHTDNKKRKNIYLLLYVGLFILLFLTHKRGFIVFTILIFFYLMIYGVKNKAKVSLIIPIFIIGIIYIIFNTEIGLSLLQRVNSQEDISSGRFFMYRIMWSDFLKKPILGFGTFTTTEYFNGLHGHNVYLQVLRENGIIGFLLLLGFIIPHFFRTHSIIKKINFKTIEGRNIIISVSLQLLFILWAFTGNPLYDPFSIYFYLIGIAMLYEVRSKITKKNQQQLH